MQRIWLKLTGDLDEEIFMSKTIVTSIVAAIALGGMATQSFAQDTKGPSVSSFLQKPLSTTMPSTKISTKTPWVKFATFSLTAGAATSNSVTSVLGGSATSTSASSYHVSIINNTGGVQNTLFFKNSTISGVSDSGAVQCVPNSQDLTSLMPFNYSQLCVSQSNALTSLFTSPSPLYIYIATAGKDGKSYCNTLGNAYVQSNQYMLSDPLKTYTLDIEPSGVCTMASS